MNDCSNCSSFIHFSSDVNIKKGGDGICTNKDAYPVFKPPEKSCHPFRIFIAELKNCLSFTKGENKPPCIARRAQGAKNEESDGIPDKEAKSPKKKGDVPEEQSGDL